METKSEEEIPQLKSMSFEPGAEAHIRSGDPGGSAHRKQATPNGERHLPAAVQFALQDEIELGPGEPCQQHIVAVAVDPQSDSRREASCRPLSELLRCKVSEGLFSKPESDTNSERDTR